MKKYPFFAILGSFLLIASAILMAQPKAMAQESAAEPTAQPPHLVAIYEAWSASPHNRAEDEAFVHWNEDGVVEVGCATCHSTPGYIDFLGADGSAAGTVEVAPPVGTTVTCDACHNQVASQLTSVSFPSGVTVENDGDAARCMVCHQGRASTDSVNGRLEGWGLLEDGNLVNAEAGFINIHYYAAAATLYGGQVRGGYQYEGMSYIGRNWHVDGFNECSDCHQPHSLEMDITACATCHEDVETSEDLLDIRMPGSNVDYDGDGDAEEGLAGEIVTLEETLMATIQAYAKEVAGAPIGYDASRYPYFFGDANDNGTFDEGEGKYVNFTANLIRAAYNYQVAKKDPGGYAHNGRYHIQLLADSITMLNAELPSPAEVNVQRDSSGHFNSSAMAFRRWDADGEVPANCARCHTAEGLPFFVEHGVNIKSEPSNSLACTTCHDTSNEFEVYAVNEVPFPSGLKVTFGEADESNMCLECHQGRESTVSVNRAITGAGVGDDEVSDKLTFRNIHYYAAGASLFGTQAQGAYEFAGKEYNGRFEHARRFNTCADCHEPHTGAFEVNDCAECHENVSTLEDIPLIRQEGEDVEAVDYDGDGDSAEPVKDEIDSLKTTLFAALQAYATETVGTGIAYDAHSHPYWYIDTNGNGTADEDEVNSDNRYVTWTPNLLRAAYNYQFVSKDPGSYAHNADYVLQVLFDSIEAVGGDNSTFNRPPVIAVVASN